LVEQPVATAEEAALLSQLTSIRISGDESIASKVDAERAVDLGAFQVTGIKLSKVGGFFAGMEIGEVMPFYVSSALDGPVGIAAGAMLAETEQQPFDFLSGPPRLAHGLATQRLFASTIAAVECELRDGMLYPPPGPGLGVEIDEDALQAHRL
jgi:L-alanine-DL-glutamate epimerase-like enolase superfamily enzyme